MRTRQPTKLRRPKAGGQRPSYLIVSPLDCSLHTDGVTHTVRVSGALRGHEARTELRKAFEALFDPALPTLCRQIDFRNLEGIDALNCAWLVDRIKSHKTAKRGPLEVLLSTNSFGQRLWREMLTYLMAQEVSFGTRLSAESRLRLLSFEL